MLNKIKKRGWMIMSGSGEEEGGWTYIGEKGASVIDYAITNEKGYEEIKGVREAKRTESDHVPIEVTIEGKNEKIGRGKEKEKKIEIEESI